MRARRGGYDRAEREHGADCAEDAARLGRAAVLPVPRLVLNRRPGHRAAEELAGDGGDEHAVVAWVAAVEQHDEDRRVADQPDAPTPQLIGEGRRREQRADDEHERRERERDVVDDRVVLQQRVEACA